VGVAVDVAVAVEIGGGAAALIIDRRGKNGTGTFLIQHRATKMSAIFCNNCGQRGHTFRDCKEPILSCGILLLRNLKTPNQPSTLPIRLDEIEILMVRRKDSMSYTDFIRGKYDPTDKAYVMMLLENMTQQELARVQCETFETLWSRLWNSSDRHEHEMKPAMEKFDQVLSEIRSARSVYVEPEWGFPKGRRLKCESDQGCAEREFFEETNIHRSSYVVVTGLQLEETFNGTNRIPYRHKYFIAVLSSPMDIDIHQRFTTMQRREISAIGWKTLADCMALTRPHYIQRRQMLQQLADIAETVEVRLPKE